MAFVEFEITDLVEQFMAVTGAEDTVAMLFLQQSGWNVQVFFTLNYLLVDERFSLFVLRVWSEEGN